MTADEGAGIDGPGPDSADPPWERTTPGWTRYVRHVFLAKDLTEGDPDTDEGEIIETLTVPVNDVLDVVRSRRGQSTGLR